MADRFRYEATPVGRSEGRSRCRWPGIRPEDTPKTGGPIMKALTGTKFRLAAVAAILALTPPQARADVLLNVNVEDSYVDEDPCTGEPIVVFGSAHLLVTTTVDGSGGQHLFVHVNYQGVRAVGLTTGTTY